MSIDRAELQKLAEEAESKLHSELALLVAIADVHGAEKAAELAQSYLSALGKLLEATMFLSLAIVVESQQVANTSGTSH